MRCALPAALLPALLAVFTPLHRVEEGVKVPYQPVMIAGVRDPVFAYLVALARDDARGELSGTALDRLVEKSGRESRLPHALLHEVSRVAGATAELPARVRVAFSDPLDVPVPYSILGYHPGSLRASRELLFDEWFLGRMRLPDDPAGGRRYLEEVRLLVLRRGELQIDIDWWVDKLFGSKLDDTEVIALALARLDDRHLGIATGLNGSGRGRSGTFDLHADEIVFLAQPPEVRRPDLAPAGAAFAPRYDP